MSARHWRLLLGAAVAGIAAHSSGALAQSAPSAQTSYTRYDVLGRVVGTIGPSASGGSSGPFLVTRRTYDAEGNLTLVEEGSLANWQDASIAPSAWSGFTLAKATAFSYDRLNRKVTQAELGADNLTYAMTQFSYNTSGRLECTAVRMNPATFGALPASACTQGIAGTQGSDRISRLVYDNAGQVLQVRGGVGSLVEKADRTIGYTTNGQVQQVVDAMGNRTTYQYDNYDRLQMTVLPSTVRPAGYSDSTPGASLLSAGSSNTADFESYTYDANGNRTSLRKRDGSVITYNYDALNRVTSKIVPERSGLNATHTRDVYYGYDLRGLQTYARFDSAVGEGVSNSYDGFGRLSASTLTMDGATRTLSYLYDANGNRVQVTFPDGQYVTYSYDGLDRPTAILRSGSATMASYAYDAAGRRTAFNGGFTTSYGYDPAGRLQTLTNNLPASTWNNQWTFGYNPAGQITSSARSNDLFAFNAVYNVDRPYTANGLNQYTAAGAVSFSYDANGNLTSDGATSFTYDIENGLVAASGGRTATLRYDPLGRLYEVSGNSGTTRFIYDGDALAMEYGSDGTILRRYVHGADARADDPIAWYEGSGFASTNERLLRPDWQGSIVAMAEGGGANMLAVNRYDEYGIPATTNAGRFQYTGQAFVPELGMYYYKARMYSPTLGRFMQTDPIGYGDGLNWYDYAGSDPANHTDYSGTVYGPTLSGWDGGFAYNSPTNDAVTVFGSKWRIPSSGFATYAPAGVGPWSTPSLMRPSYVPRPSWPSRVTTPTSLLALQKESSKIKDTVCGLSKFLPGDGIYAGFRAIGGLGFLLGGSSNIRISDSGRVTSTITSTMGIGAGMIGPFKAGFSSPEPTAGASYESGTVGGIALGGAILKYAKGGVVDFGSIGVFIGEADSQSATYDLYDFGC